jgi:DNA-binding HxlR family transcriptional regulator
MKHIETEESDSGGFVALAKTVKNIHQSILSSNLRTLGLEKYYSTSHGRLNTQYEIG